jgi:hypothetical protein
MLDHDIVRLVIDTIRKNEGNNIIVHICTLFLDDITHESNLPFFTLNIVRGLQDLSKIDDIWELLQTLVNTYDPKTSNIGVSIHTLSQRLTRYIESQQ